MADVQVLEEAGGLDSLVDLANFTTEQKLLTFLLSLRKKRTLLSV